MTFSAVYSASRYAGIECGLRGAANYTASVSEQVTASDGRAYQTSHNMNIFTPGSGNRSAVVPVENRTGVATESRSFTSQEKIT